MKPARRRSRYEAVIENVVRRAANGAYAVARAESIRGSVTFSLEVWPLDRLPEVGEVVWLEDVTRYRAGWRAHGAIPTSPDDEANPDDKAGRVDEE